MGRNKQLYPLFVYGTLMSGEHYHDHLDDSHLVGRGMVPGQLYWVRLGAFPGAIFEDGPSRVYGEVYLVTREVREQVDILEGYTAHKPETSFYVRRPVTVSMENGSDTEAEAYEYRGKLWPAMKIESGDFRRAPRLLR